MNNNLAVLNNRVEKDDLVLCVAAAILVAQIERIAELEEALSELHEAVLDYRTTGKPALGWLHRADDEARRLLNKEAK